MAYLDYEGLQHFKDKENEQVAPVESSNTSANAYEIGKYFWHEGNYCKAKTAIAVGDAFVQNTNYTVVKIGDEIEKKANTDGYYEAMTVGNAEQLVATEGVEDSTPYVFRKAGGGLAIANREADTLVGGTIAWNQLIQNGNMDADTNWSVQSNATKSFSNNVATMTITSATGAGQFFQMVKVASDHKYLACGYIKPSANKNIYMRFGSITGSVLHSCVANTWNFIWSIKTPGSVDVYSRSEFNFYIPEGSISVGETYQIKSAMCFDLTQMFGATIADYIYSLEQSNAGDGVAWFKNLFPNDYYAYDAGTLMSVNTSAHVTTGKNLWDFNNYSSGYINAQGQIVDDPSNPYRHTGYIQVVPNETYTWSLYHIGSGETKRVHAYDGDKNWIQQIGYINIPTTSSPTQYSVSFTIPDNAKYVMLSYSSSDSNNMIEFGATATEYESYDGHTYLLDSELTIRGIPKLDANNNLYYDGDIYEADGAVTRKYGAIDLGTLTFNYDSPHTAFFANLPTDAKNETSINGVCQKYVPYTGTLSSTSWATLGDGQFVLSKNLSTVGRLAVAIRDTAYSDPTTFKTAMSGVYLVYELASATSEQAEPYASNQIVSGDGTEEYVDAGVQAGTRDVSVPVGHNTIYQQDLRTKLQDAPDSPSEDGDYIMRRINGQNTYNKGNFAETNGNYPNMTVGNAEQLVSTIGIEDKTPYNFRTSGGSIDIGDRETDMVVGGTIAWNQLCANGNFSNGTTGWVGSKFTVSVADGAATLVVADTGDIYYDYQYLPNANHIYLLIVEAKADSGNEGAFGLRAYYNGTANYKSISFVNDSSWHTYSRIVSETAGNANNRLRIYGSSSVAVDDTVMIKNACIFDITKMFGATIANYVYNLEQTTAGAGEAWFKSLFPKPYYAYNAGTLLSVNTSAHNMTGFNQWDEQWELGEFNTNTGAPASSSTEIRSKNYIPVVPNTRYYIKTNNVDSRVFEYDADKNFITSKSRKDYVFTTESNTYYIRFYLYPAYGTTYKNDICINISWDGERDGEYEPYVEYNYPLDSSIELRGIPKLDSANNLYYDGDTYESDGTVNRKFVEATITVSGMYIREGNANFDFAYFALPEAWTTPIHGNFFGEKILTKNMTTFDSANETGVLVPYSTNNKQMGAAVPKGYTQAQAEALFNGSKLIYAVLNPTTETAEPYQNPQIVDDFGTEEYVDYAETQGTRDVSVPVGHETVYAPNLRAKLETAPDSPQSDGDYIVRQTNGENQYVQLVIPQELPNTPGTDGTYTLQVSVSSGTATLSWVSAT